jgi:hypothetical protein
MVTSTVMTRLPRGYRGIDHETIGSDVLALLDSVLMPEQLLGKELVQRLRAVRPSGWYPIALLLEPLEMLDKRLGADSIRKVGHALFRLSHEEGVRQKATSARDIVYGIDAMYRAANRGREIGGWSVISFTAGKAILEKTTPHHCVLEEGILDAGLRVVGVPAVIKQEMCFRRGDDSCVLTITSHVTDQRWSGRFSSADSGRNPPSQPIASPPSSGGPPRPPPSSRR